MAIVVFERVSVDACVHEVIFPWQTGASEVSRWSGLHQRAQADLRLGEW
ncbi:hypothetical protein KW412_08585 [Vibrio fluvialis]|nr:hypothetical protein [Vibrio fluvialis]